MAIEVWLRNPKNYVREAVEAGVTNFAWDRGFLIKAILEPQKFCNHYLPPEMPYRNLIIGDQGTQEVDREHDRDRPKAVYPTWTYGENSMLELEELMASPVGFSAAACGDTSIPIEFRPVLGQEHRIVITKTPVFSSGPGIQLMRMLRELQQEYIGCILHVHGFYSFRAMFGYGIRSCDMDPRTSASKGAIVLANGRETVPEKVTHPEFLDLIGMSVDELKVARNRCIFSIRSALWASEHFGEAITFATKPPVGFEVDTESVTVPVPIRRGAIARGTSKPGDKLVCDMCSLSETCTHFRVGGICTVPGSEAAPLARLFKTKDAQVVIDGLGTVLALQTERLEMGIENEKDMNELDGEVTKVANSILSHGVKLAKLLDPALAAAGAPKINFNTLVAGGSSSINELTAQVMQEIEATGIPRHEITPEMVMAYLDRMEEKEPASIEATSRVS